MTDPIKPGHDGNGTDAAMLASMIISAALRSGEFLQAHYLSSEPQLMDIAWRIAAMPAKARSLLRSFLTQAKDPQTIGVKRSGDTLVLVLGDEKARPKIARVQQRMQ